MGIVAQFVPDFMYARCEIVVYELQSGGVRGNPRATHG